VNPIERRSFLIAWLELWLFALFPALRPAPEACAVLAEKLYERLPARIFQGGEMNIRTIIRGFEVDSDWCKALIGNPELRAALMGELGLR
jgi:hypothetical protein